MRLFEHPDFEQAVIRAADHFRPRGLREAIIEKDYYVTEALRIIEQAAGPQMSVTVCEGITISARWASRRNECVSAKWLPCLAAMVFSRELS